MPSRGMEKKKDRTNVWEGQGKGQKGEKATYVGGAFAEAEEK